MGVAFLSFHLFSSLDPHACEKDSSIVQSPRATKAFCIAGDSLSTDPGAMAAATIVSLPSEAPFSVDASSSVSDIKDSNPRLQVSLQNGEIANENENFLVVSTYEELPHLLDLRTLNTGNQLLARALIRLECLRDDYATAEYVEIFNWSEVVQEVKRLAAASNYDWKKGMGTNLLVK